MATALAPVDILKELRRLRGEPALLPRIESYLNSGQGLDTLPLRPLTLARLGTRNPLDRLLGGLGSPDSLDSVQARSLDLAVRLGLGRAVVGWLLGLLEREGPQEDHFTAVAAQLERLGVSVETLRPLVLQGLPIDWKAQPPGACLREGQPTSLGRHLLSLADADLVSLLQASLSRPGSSNLLLFLAQADPERCRRLGPAILDPRALSHPHKATSGAALLVGLDAGFLSVGEQVFNQGRDSLEPSYLFPLAQALTRADRTRWGPRAVQLAEELMDSGSYVRGPVAGWLVETFQDEVLEALMERVRQGQDDLAYLLARHFGIRAVEAVRLHLERQTAPYMRCAALGWLVDFQDPSLHQEIAGPLEVALGQEEFLRGFIALAARFDLGRFEERIWSLTAHRLREVRLACVGALLQGRGPEVLPRALQLLAHKKAEARSAAVMLLTRAGTPEALQALEKRLDVEGSEEVRDEILQALEDEFARQGRTLTMEEVRSRIDRMKARLTGLPLAWLEEAQLPPLYTRDGTPLDSLAVRYLLHRQARVSGIREDLEARPLYALLDPSKSGDFALHLLRGFLEQGGPAKEGWVLTVVARLGDERVVPPLQRALKGWIETNRLKFAEYAVEALALQGSDAALLALDAAVLRYSQKPRNVGEAAQEAFSAAAEARGLSLDELRDRVVPWLGFTPGQPRLLKASQAQTVEVSVGMDYKLKYRWVEKNKTLSSLPKTVSDEERQELKELGPVLAEAAKSQVLRLESLMVAQHCWEAQDWQLRFLEHPLLFPAAVRLVWAAVDPQGALVGTFRALEDRTLTTAEEEPFRLESGQRVCLLHPLMLEVEPLDLWRTHLAEHSLEPLFAQLERPVFRAPAELADLEAYLELEGCPVEAPRLKRETRRGGWIPERGGGGSIESYLKTFGASRIRARVGVEGMHVVLDMCNDVSLGGLSFLDDHGRPLPLGTVPAAVLSEAVCDLHKILGKSLEGSEPHEP